MPKNYFFLQKEKIATNDFLSHARQVCYPETYGMLAHLKQYLFYCLDEKLVNSPERNKSSNARAKHTPRTLSTLANPAGPSPPPCECSSQ